MIIFTLFRRNDFNNFNKIQKGFGDEEDAVTNNERQNTFNRGGNNARGNYRNRDRFNEGRGGYNNRNNFDFHNKFRNFNNQDQGNRFHRQNIAPENFKFFKEHEKNINRIKEIYEYLDDNNFIIDILKETINNTKITIFEFMNTLHRENIIKRHTKFSNENFKHNSKKKLYIFEQDKDLLTENDKFFIEKYKTVCFDNYHNKDVQNLEKYDIDLEFYKENDEKRRIIVKNIDGFFNYIPEACTIHDISANDNEGCIYAHSQNEIKYHSLYFKTKFCSVKCNLGIECENAHEANELRKIYEYSNKKDMPKFILKMEKFLKKNGILKDYLEYIPKLDKFSLDTYKVHKCRFQKCNIDPHVCYYYHNEYERRRHPRLFQLENERCEYKFINMNDMNNPVCKNVNIKFIFH